MYSKVNLLSKFLLKTNIVPCISGIGMAGGITGREGAAAGEIVGDGDIPQGSSTGHENSQPGQVSV